MRACYYGRKSEHAFHARRAGGFRAGKVARARSCAAGDATGPGGTQSNNLLNCKKQGTSIPQLYATQYAPTRIKLHE
jgi:hypothetical protein